MEELEYSKGQKITKRPRFRISLNVLCTVRNGHAHISNTPELFQHIPRQERQDRVLGRDDLVAVVHMLSLDFSFMIQIILWEVFVDMDCARGAWGPLGREEILDLEIFQAFKPDDQQIRLARRGRHGEKNEEKGEGMGITRRGRWTYSANQEEHD